VNSSLSVSTDREAPPQLPQADPKQEIWNPLDLLLAESPGLARWHNLAVEESVVPSYVFIGPRGGHVPIRLALIAGMEPEDVLSTSALVKLFVELDLAPLLAQDFALFGYPIANPHRTSCCSSDFTANFWKNATDPVIRYFERELTENQLDGIIAIVANEPIEGFQMQVSSRVIGSEVLWPGLELTQRVVPLSSDPIQIFPQLESDRHSVFSLGHARPGPFSLRILTPKNMPFENQVSAIVFSVKQILHYYRVLVSHAAHL
jgi:hypothetical protein